ncbi:hypothetical protein KY290_010113 [Solanum tuberosum]|uniref:Retrovirus-related Pol polyprotein from transposon TNT 1-94-like beta-barrel domain-containing protein n=1 Tax=Solanum tuberosum TaxID=4113 RepID=A0ABQ7VWU2_SOLTU|nr:hypothetical protein KY289_010495 [Solanum tuberosum]KAH0772976.1 hypothetical protein KY290_010113 [Solanum tuberosum]
MVDDNISSSSSLQGTTVRIQTSTVTTLPSPSLAHQLPLKLTSSIFLLWKTQFLQMVRGCGLGHHIDGSQVIPGQFMSDDQPNPDYHKNRSTCVKLDRCFRSKPQIRELKTQLHTLQRDNTSIESYVQRAKRIADKLAALQHPDISFDVLYGLLLNEERQLKRDETLNVIAPTTLYTQSSYPPGRSRDRDRGRGNRGRGRFQNHGFSQMPQQRSFQNTTQSSNIPSPTFDMSTIICHNCEGKCHIARVFPSPKTSNGTRVSGRPVSNLANTQSSTQNWLMDSGTTHHLTSDLDNLGIHSEYQGPEEVTLGNDSKLPISHIGASSIVASDKNFKLDDILHVPTATQNLVSFSSFTKSNNVSVEFFPDHFFIKDLATRVPLHKGWTNRGLYSLPVTKLSSPASFATSLGV